MGLICRRVPIIAAAPDTLPPCLRCSKVSTVNQWQTFCRWSFTHWTSSSSVRPSFCFRAASRTRKPSPTEAQRLSMQITLPSGYFSWSSAAQSEAVWKVPETPEVRQR